MAEVGQILRDKESEDKVVLIEKTDKAISEEVVYEEPDGTPVTVADYNEEYDDDERCVRVVYIESLDRHIDDWRELNVRELKERIDELNEERTTIRVYSFPESRLVL